MKKLRRLLTKWSDPVLAELRGDAFSCLRKERQLETWRVYGDRVELGEEIVPMCELWTPRIDCGKDSTVLTVIWGDKPEKGVGVRYSKMIEAGDAEISHFVLAIRDRMFR